MKTTPYTFFNKLSFLIIFAFIFTYCSEVEDFVIDRDNILGIWNFDKEISHAGEESSLTGTIEFSNDGTFVVTDNNLNGSEWQFANNYYNPELYNLTIGNKSLEILELTSKNMVWNFEAKLYFLSKE